MAKQKNSKLSFDEKLLRSFIKEIFLKEGPVGASLTSPQDPKGFYGYDLSMGDTQSKFWYRSPARGMGSDGDPGRPSDAAEYIGLKIPPVASSGPEEGIGDVDSTPGDAGALDLSKIEV